MVWLHLSGMSWWLVPFFLVIAFGVMFGMTRIVAEGGLAVTKTPLVPVDAAIGTFSASQLGHTNLGALGLTFPWAGGMRVTLMAAVIHGLRLAEHYVTAHRRRLFLRKDRPHVRTGRAERRSTGPVPRPPRVR